MAKNVQDGTAVYGMSTYRIPMLVNGKDNGMERYQQEDYFADFDSIDKAFKESLNASKRPIAGGGVDHSREDAMYLKQKKAADGEKIVDNLVETTDAGMTIADALSMGALAGLGGKLLLEGGKAIGKKVGKKIPSMGSKRGFFNAEWQKAHPEYDAKALQYAMTKDILDEHTANALVRGTDKTRDELTTVINDIKENNIPILHSKGGGGYVENGSSWNDAIKAYEQRPIRIDLGDNPSTALHELGHYYHGLSAKANPNVKEVTTKAGNVNRWNKSDMQDETADKIDEIFFNSKAGEAYKKYDNKLKKDLNILDLRDDLKKLGDHEGRITTDLADYGAMIPLDKGGVFLTPSGVKNGYIPNAMLETKNYVADFKKLGQPRIGTEEGSNNIIGEALTSRINDNYLRKIGINPDEVANIKFNNHIPYTAEKEMELAKKYAGSPDYNEFIARTPAKIRPTGSHANKFFAKEAKYMAENGGDHSPDWYEAVHDKWFGDRFGRLHEDEMEALFNKWKKDNNVSIYNDESVETLLDKIDLP